MDANGPIPDGLQVLHSCDDPPCIEPAHLWLGTNLDNIADKSAKGRVRVGDRRGEKHPLVKITETDAIAVFIRVRAGETIKAVAASVGISCAQAGRIAKGQRWPHIKERFAA